MPIPVTCRCGKKMNVKDEAAGKRVRCPACQQLVNIPVPEAEEPIEAIEIPEEPELLEEDEETPRPKKKKKRPREKRSNTLLYSLIGGGALLLFCCCPIGGGGAWYIFFGSNASEKDIIGKWDIDFDTAAKNTTPRPSDAELKAIKDLIGNIQYEFKADHTVISHIQTFGMNMSIKSTWRVVKSQGKTLTVEMSAEKLATEKLDITVLDSDHLKFSGLEGGKASKAGRANELYFRRAK
jgi:hypothetical protein